MKEKQNNDRKVNFERLENQLKEKPEKIITFSQLVKLGGKIIRESDWRF
jgi:hypothetical protein